MSSIKLEILINSRKGDERIPLPAKAGSPLRYFYGSKSWDRTCRNHGSCGRCKKDRIHKYKKQELCASDKLRDFKWY